MTFMSVVPTSRTYDKGLPIGNRTTIGWATNASIYREGSINLIHRVVFIYFEIQNRCLCAALV